MILCLDIRIWNDDVCVKLPNFSSLFQTFYQHIEKTEGTQARQKHKKRLFYTIVLAYIYIYSSIDIFSFLYDELPDAKKKYGNNLYS